MQFGSEISKIISSQNFFATRLRISFLKVQDSSLICNLKERSFGFGLGVRMSYVKIDFLNLKSLDPRNLNCFIILTTSGYDFVQELTVRLKVGSSN